MATLYRLMLLLALATATNLWAEEKTAEAVPTSEQQAQIAKYITGLSDESFETRTASKLALLKMGYLAKAQLLDVQEKKDSDPETLAAVTSALNILENPLRRARVGDWITSHHTIKSSLDLSHDVRQEVKKVTETEITIEYTEIWPSGSKQSSLVTWPLETPKPNPAAQANRKEVGRGVDPLEVQGRKVKCEWVKYDLSDKGNKSIALTIWTTTGLPPLADSVKTEFVSTGMNFTCELRDFGRGPDSGSADDK